MKPTGILLLFSPIFFLLFIHPVSKKLLPALPKSHQPVSNTIANAYYIIIDKSDYELKVYDEEGWLATYPVVFGSNDMRDKFMEGDKRTPEGQFKVLLKKIHPKWGPELLLDFPNPETMKKFLMP